MLKQKFKSCCDSSMHTENLVLDTKAKRKLKKICIGKRYRKKTLMSTYLFPLCIVYLSYFENVNFIHYSNFLYACPSAY